MFAYRMVAELHMLHYNVAYPTDVDMWELKMI